MTRALKTKPRTPVAARTAPLRSAVTSPQAKVAGPPLRPRAPAPPRRSPPSPPRQLPPRAGDDPAAIVDWALAAPRIPLPHAATARAHVGRPLDGLIVLGGARAWEACAALSARAFAVDNVVAFARPDPSLATVLHEVAHVMQRGAFNALRPRHAPGSIAIAGDGDRHELEAARFTAMRTPLSAAPRLLFREGEGDETTVEVETVPEQPDTTYADLKTLGTKLLLRLALTDKFRPREIKAAAKPPKKGDAPLAPAVFGERGADGKFTTLYKYSSPGPFRFDDVFNELDAAATDPSAPARPETREALRKNIERGRKTLLFTTTGVVIGGVRYVARGVGPATLLEAKYFAFIGPAHGATVTPPPTMVQEVAAAAYDKSEPGDILDDYARVITDARKANKDDSTTPAKEKLTALEPLAAVEKNLADAKAGLAAKDRTRQWESVEEQRKALIEAIVTIWTDIDQLHRHVITTPAMNSQSGLKGNLFETWVGRYVNKAGYIPDTTKEPIFGTPLKGNQFLKSAKLLKVRRGDGFLLTTADHQNIIAEAKAYQDAPKGDSDDLVLQIQDYNVILNSSPPIQGWIKVVDEYKPFTFVAIHYNFSNGTVAKKWVPFLDKYLPGKYKIVQPTSFVDTPTAATTLEAWKAALVKLRKLTGTKLDDKLLGGIATDVDTTLGKPTTSDDEKKTVDTDVASLTTRLAQAVAAGFPKIDDLYAKVLSPTPGAVIFEAPHLAIVGRIFEEWLKASATGVNLDKAQNPLRGELAERTPLFSDEARALSFKSTTVSNVVTAKSPLWLLDNVVVATSAGQDKIGSALVLRHEDLLGEPKPPRPTDAESTELADYALLVTKKARTYYQSKAGTSNMVVAREFTALNLRFGDVDAAKPWAAVVKTHLTKPQDYAIAPNPAGEKSYSLFITANPTFELKIADADKLEHTFTADDIKVKSAGGVVQKGDKLAGATITAATIKLKGQRSKEIDSGSITMSMAAGDVVKSSAPTAKPVRPSLEPPKANAPIHGSIENKVGGLSSALDNLLKRVTTDAALVDGGIKATIHVAAGPSGLANIDLEAAEVGVTYRGGTKFEIDSRIGLRHTSGKLSGELKVKWSQNALSIKGSVHGQPGLLPGLESFDGEIEYTKTTTEAAEGVEPATEESLKITVKKAALRKAMRGVTFVGSIENMVYDVKTGLFSGTVKDLGVEMGPFGKATATATFKDSELASVVVIYASPVLSFPKKSPLVTGQLNTDIAYQDGKWSGGVTGTAQLAIPALQKLAPKTPDNKPAPPLGLEVKVKLSPEGGWSGSIATTTAIGLGKYFSIESIKLDLAENGDVSGKFGLKLSGIKYLKEATATCTFDKDGFKVAAFSVTGEFGTPNESKFWGSAKAAWDGSNFKVTVNANVKIRDNIIGSGTLTYDSATNTADGELKVSKIQVLGPKSKNYELFKFQKQIPLFAVGFPAPPVIGMYLDVGVKVGFDIAYDVSVTPTLTLKGFSLDTFNFASISASMLVAGSLSASLNLVPSVGLGLFVLSPMVARAGGGLRLPVSAKATVDASANPTVKYEREKPEDPESPYTLKTWAPISLVIKFGITAALQAYAEFVLLDGVFKYPWETTLKTFEIMPERELMRYTLNVGDPPANADPATGPGKAPPAGATEPKTTTEGEKQEPVDRTPPAENEKTPKNEPKEPTGDASEGFSLKSILDKVKELETYKKLASLLESAANLVGAIGAFFRKIYNYVKKWIGDALDALEEAMTIIRRDGLFVWVKSFLADRITAVSPTLADLVLPVLDALKNSEDQLRDAILSADKVGSVGGFLELAFSIIPILLGAAWDSATALASGLKTVWDKLSGAAVSKLRGLVNELITAKKLGVMRGTGVSAYGYRIHLGPIDKEGFDDVESRAIATALLVALEAIGATPVGDGYWA